MTGTVEPARPGAASEFRVWIAWPKPSFRDQGNDTQATALLNKNILQPWRMVNPLSLVDIPPDKQDEKIRGRANGIQDHNFTGHIGKVIIPEAKDTVQTPQLATADNRKGPPAFQT